MGFLFYNHLNSKYTTKGHGKHAPTKVFFKIWGSVQTYPIFITPIFITPIFITPIFITPFL
ncbi:hypothetical protein A9Z63_03995 [Moraxella lacunata]|nr:hypothetical protein A9Z63_03995 [Moraxella lacunata]